MSIEYCERYYSPVCDVCGKFLEPEIDYEEAVLSIEGAGWEYWMANGMLEVICDECSPEALYEDGQEEEYEDYQDGE